MGNDQTRVDILTLEDFRKTLDARLSEAESVLRSLNSTSADGRPALGAFLDATRTASSYLDRHAQQVGQVQRLITAIQATQTATSTIIKNYRSAEARNTANSADIASVLGGVHAALDGGANG
jgi:hypothetical protein